MRTADCLVIGAGMAGASLACELAAQRHVIVLEAEEVPGYHTTGRSAAQFLAAYGNNVARRLTHASRAFLDAPPAAFADHPLLSPRRALFIARADQMEHLARLERDVGALAPTVERVSGEKARALFPVLREDYAAGALLEAEAMDIDVHALHQGYLRGLRRRGGDLVLNARVTSLSRAQGLWAAETPAGTLRAPIVVNAAGAWADEIGKLAGAPPIGLVPKRRTVITFDAPPGAMPRDWPLAIDVDESFYIKPESGHLLASPADATPMPPCDVQPDELDVAITVDRIERATTLRIRRIERKWAGLRSFVADGAPVAGFDEAVEGLFWLAGQGGWGIQTAPAMARGATALIVGGHLPDDLVALGVDAAVLAPARLRAAACDTG